MRSRAARPEESGGRPGEGSCLCIRSRSQPCIPASDPQALGSQGALVPGATQVGDRRSETSACPPDSGIPSSFAGIRPLLPVAVLPAASAPTARPPRGLVLTLLGFRRVRPAAPLGRRVPASGQLRVGVSRPRQRACDFSHPGVDSSFLAGVILVIGFWHVALFKLKNVLWFSEN